jgi:hypothetical protein
MAEQVSLIGTKYYVTAVLPDGRLIHLENVAENIAWEENESELAVRLNLTIRDVPFEKSTLSKQLKLCTMVYLYAKWNGEKKKQEIFRGTIWEWEHSEIKDDAIIITCYDMLYYLQKSSDNKYYAKGKKTGEICKDILNSWDVTLYEYTGPSISHEKTLYKNKTISAMLTDTLDEAKKKTGKKGIIRAVEGKCRIITQGTNDNIWNFTAASNLISSSDKYSMVNLVTRVIITGKEDKDGKPKIEATVDGKVEYGILQQIKSKGDTSLEDAKKEAQETLDEKGSPERTTTLVAPDIPTLRKGDLIHVKTDKMKGYFYIKGISHNATSGTMQMEVEPHG